MAYPDTPHLEVPLRFAGDKMAVVEQDSDAEIIQCVQATLSYRPGERLDDDEFGLREQAFIQNGADLDEIRQAITRWEPRADFELEYDDSQLAQMIETVSINMNVRSTDG